MARALSNATLTAALSDGLTLLINRRGYSAASAAAAAAAVGRPARGMPVEEKAAGKRDGPAAADAAAAAAASSSWVPDPVTGCYRPANRLVETDAVELREMHLSHKSRG